MRFPLRLCFAIITLCIMVPLSHAAARIPQGVVLEGAPPVSDLSINALQTYLNARSATFFGWLSDDSMIVRTRFAETPQIHRVLVPNGAREQVSFEPEGVRFPTVGPNLSDGVIYGVDEGGGENYQLVHLDLLTKEKVRLTDNAARNSDPVWSHSGQYFVYSTTGRNGSDTDIHLYNFNTNTSRPLLERNGTYFATDWSADDRSVIISQYSSVQNQVLYIVDVATGSARRLVEDTTPASHKAGRFAPDGSGVWFVSDLDTEFHTLRFHHFETGKVRDFTRHIKHDVEIFEISPNGNTVALVVNEDGIDKLYFLDARKGKLSGPVEQLSNMARITSLEFNRSGTDLGLTLESSSFPGDAFSISMRKKELTRWTKSELSSLTDDDLQEPQLISFATFDMNSEKTARRAVPAWYYKPLASGPHPVLIFVHGGPESQARPEFSPLLHVLLNEMNIAVIYPNIRGSSGYGKEYLSLDNQYKRRDAIKDIDALVDWISSQPDLDNSKIAIMGGSYGGFVALSSMTQFPDKFAAGISLVGISDFFSFLSQTKDYRKDLRRIEYGDESDPQMRAFLRRISPLHSANLIEKPLLIAQGKNDPRVPESNSRQIVDAVRKQGQEVWYMLATEEGHGFTKKSSRDYYFALVVEFLRKHLIGTVEELPPQNAWNP